MNVLVTGGAGFIGSHLADRLLVDGHKVLVIDDLSTGLKTNLKNQEILKELNINDQKVFDIFHDFKPEVVYHLAAQKNVRSSLDDPINDARINILGSLNILQAALKEQVKHFIFVSTGGAIYGETDIIPTDEQALEQPICPYGLAKLSFEKYLGLLAKDKMSWSVLRLANVYGPRQDPKGEAGVIAIFLDNINKSLPLEIYGDGRQTRDYIFVADVVEAAIKLLDNPNNETYNIGTAKETSLLELVETLKQIVSQNIEVIHQPAIEGEVKRSCLSTQKALTNLDWQVQTDLFKGLTLTHQWFSR